MSFGKGPALVALIAFCARYVAVCLVVFVSHEVGRQEKTSFTCRRRMGELLLLFSAFTDRHCRLNSPS